MRIVNLNNSEFEEFANCHALRNYCQTFNYAKVMVDKGYSHEFIGYKDDSNNLVGASLILKKKIGTFAKFVYAPKGVLIDYYDSELVKKFFKDLCSYYKKRGYSFLKINPEIIIGEVKRDSFNTSYNQNVSIIDTLKDFGFKRRREIYPLDFLFPRINPYINLKKYEETLDISDINEIASMNGFSIEIGDKKDLDTLGEFINDKVYNDLGYYKSILSSFGNNAELFLLKINYEECLINARERYHKELENNNYYNELIQSDTSDASVLGKMESDKNLLKYKDEVVHATEGLKHNKIKFIGGAIVVKYQNRVSIVVDGFEDNVLYSKIYLYNYLIERYKDEFEFLDLNGLASDNGELSKFYDFNKSKLDFNPVVYEFIGEFDIVLNELLFKKIQSKGLLSKEFLPSHKF